MGQWDPLSSMTTAQEAPARDLGDSSACRTGRLAGADRGSAEGRRPTPTPPDPKRDPPGGPSTTPTTGSAGTASTSSASSRSATAAASTTSASADATPTETCSSSSRTSTSASPTAPAKSYATSSSTPPATYQPQPKRERCPKTPMKGVPRHRISALGGPTRPLPTRDLRKSATLGL